jgi:hypothetical protein
VLVPSLLVRLALVALAGSIAGCVNLYAGIARYDIKPFYDAQSNRILCCEATVTSGKNVGQITAHVTKVGDNYTFDIVESDVNASTSIAASGQVASSVAAAVTGAAVTAAKLVK